MTRLHSFGVQHSGELILGRWTRRGRAEQALPARFPSQRCGRVDSEPNNPDTDGDGIGDLTEINNGTDPLDPNDPVQQVAGLPLLDDDGDGIANDIDTEPDLFSNDFDDSAGTSGTIVDRADLFVAVQDAPGNGVTIAANGGGGTASVDVGGGTISLTDGDEIAVSVGSVIVEVVVGPVEVAVGDVSITVEAGATATITDNGNGTVTVSSDAASTANVTVSVDGADDVVLLPGDSITAGGVEEPVAETPIATFSLSLNLGVNLIGWLGGSTTSADILAGNADIDIVWSVVDGVWVADSTRLPADARVTIAIDFGSGLVIVTTTATTLEGVAV